MTIGVDLGGTKVLAALVEKDRIVKSFEEPTQKHDVVNQLTHLIQSLAPFEHVGIGIPGQVHKGVVILAPNLDMHHVPLQDKLEAALGKKVTLANDVQAGAIGEYLYGSCKGAKRVLVVQLGTGIGGAILVEGHLLRGTAGEVGHMVIEKKGRPCSCGRKGCFEAYASGWALAKAAGTSTGRQAFEAGDSPVIQEAYQALVVGFANLVNLLNPTNIVLGGGLTHGFLNVYKDFYPRLQQDVQKEALQAAQDFTILPSTQPNVIGCAALNLIPV